MHNSCRVVSRVFQNVRLAKTCGSDFYVNLKFVNVVQSSLRHSSIKAALCHKINEPLKVEEVKEKKLKKGEVRIQVNYCGLNPRDLLLLQGSIEAKAPFVPGYEVSGVVLEKVKSDEETEDLIEVGDKVVALTKSAQGGLSSHCIALEKDVWKYNSLEPKIAAGLIVNYGHALLSLFRRAKIKENTTLLITVDSGGLGLAALDIAANVYKAKVVGVCGSEEKADMLRERGAWSAMKMDLENLKASVGNVTEKKGVDVVYETVGRDFLKGAMQWEQLEAQLNARGESLYRRDELRARLQAEGKDPSQLNQNIRGIDEPSLDQPRSQFEFGGPPRMYDPFGLAGGMSYGEDYDYNMGNPFGLTQNDDQSWPQERETGGSEDFMENSTNNNLESDGIDNPFMERTFGGEENPFEDGSAKPFSEENFSDGKNLFPDEDFGQGNNQFTGEDYSYGQNTFSEENFGGSKNPFLGEEFGDDKNYLSEADIGGRKNPFPEADFGDSPASSNDNPFAEGFGNFPVDGKKNFYKEGTTASMKGSDPANDGFYTIPDSPYAAQQGTSASMKGSNVDNDGFYTIPDDPQTVPPAATSVTPTPGAEEPPRPRKQLKESFMKDREELEAYMNSQGDSIYRRACDPVNPNGYGNGPIQPVKPREVDYGQGLGGGFPYNERRFQMPDEIRAELAIERLSRAVLAAQSRRRENGEPPLGPQVVFI